MSRRAGQVSVIQALVGFAGIVGAVLAIVAFCGWLLLDTETVPTLPAPAGDDAAFTLDGDECPTPPAEPDDAVLAVTSAALIECPDFFDGRTVSYEGEVVGAVLRRVDFAWVQLNDDAYALAAGPLPQHRTALGGNSGMAVAVPLSVAAELGAVGGFERQGALVAVVGEFLRTDPADGGGPTIDAAIAEITRPGRAFTHEVSTRRVVTAATFTLLTALLGFATWRRVRAQR